MCREAALCLVLAEASSKASTFVEKLEKTHFYGSLPYKCTKLNPPAMSKPTGCKSRPQRTRRPSVTPVDLKGKRCLRSPIKKEVVDVVKEATPPRDREIQNVVVVAEGNIIKLLIDKSINRMLNNRIKDGSITIINTSHSRLGSSGLSAFRCFLDGTPPGSSRITGLSARPNAHRCTGSTALPAASQGRSQGCRNYDNSLISYLEVYNDNKYLNSQDLL
eukprot:GHVQ01029828.1.p2 GENE.GHVQ01029828.1~~GHVQ01029828.1.p2  ORF type:complete len:219 (-),score=23.69 GHVQ01029828.1:1254-1910(-)